MDFEKKEFYGIVAKAKKQMQITIDQDCNVADTKPDIEKMIQTRRILCITRQFSKSIMRTSLVITS